MAYLMTDVAAGGQAALQLQQSMAAAPNVQQVEANKMQAQANELQQQQQTIEKTRLSNMVADSGFKASEDSKAKLQALTQTPEWKAADDATRLRQSAAVQMGTGDVVNGAASLTAAEKLDAAKVAIDQKKHLASDEAIGKAYAVISAVPDDKVQEFFDRLPEENKKAMIDKVGQGNWDAYTGEQKKEVAKTIMMSTKGQLATQLKEVEIEKAQIQAASLERRARITADAAIYRKTLGGGSDREMRDWNIYTRAQEAVEKTAAKPLALLDAKVEAAQGKVDKTTFFSGAETKVLNAAIAERDTFQRKNIQKQLTLATSAPDFPGKKEVVENLKAELSMYGDEKKEVPVPKPEAKATAPAAGGLQGQVEKSGQKYEPTKYDYRVAPDGSIQRKAK